MQCEYVTRVYYCDFFVMHWLFGIPTGVLLLLEYIMLCDYVTRGYGDHPPLTIAAPRCFVYMVYCVYILTFVFIFCCVCVYWNYWA